MLTALLPTQTRIGILGGGQLGKMISLSASKLGYETHIFTNTADSPAVFVTKTSTIGSFDDIEKLAKFAANIDVAVIEFENIPVNAVQAVSAHVPVYPGIKALAVSQNRITEKQHICALGLPMAPYAVIHNSDELLAAAKDIGLPAILKTAEMGYDGKGQYKICTESDICELKHLDFSRGYVLERQITISTELSVIVAIATSGSNIFFPVAENKHIDGVLSESSIPAKISNDMRLKVEEAALKIAQSLDLVGILAVEFFVDTQGELLVNEIAPRPHNSGHWSIDACNVSQFEQLVRAICGLPLRQVHTMVPCVMKNIFGDNTLGNPTYSDPHMSISLYGKQPRDGRKMGHINVLQY